MKTSPSSTSLRATGPRLRFIPKGEDFTHPARGPTTKTESLRRLRRFSLPKSRRVLPTTHRAVLRKSRFLLTTPNLFRVRLLGRLLCKERRPRSLIFYERAKDRVREFPFGFHREDSSILSLPATVIRSDCPALAPESEQFGLPLEFRGSLASANNCAWLRHGPSRP